jgi:hypothetical protein
LGAYVAAYLSRLRNQHCIKAPSLLVAKVDEIEEQRGQPQAKPKDHPSQTEKSTSLALAFNTGLPVPNGSITIMMRHWQPRNSSSDCPQTPKITMEMMTLKILIAQTLGKTTIRN